MTEEWRRKCDLEYFIGRCKRAIAEYDIDSDEGWWACYATTLYRDNEPDFIARPLIYDRMNDAEKAEFERLEKQTSIDNLKPLNEFCFAIYKRELPKLEEEYNELKT